jgi:hypothetical protein
MVAKNDITGDSIQSRTSSKQYTDNYDKIFRKSQQQIDDEKALDEAFDDIERLKNLRNEQK